MELDANEVIQQIAAQRNSALDSLAACQVIIKKLENEIKELKEKPTEE